MRSWRRSCSPAEGRPDQDVRDRTGARGAPAASSTRSTASTCRFTRQGSERDSVFAFARRHGSEYAITCVPRLVASVVPDAGHTAARRRLARHPRRVACRCADRLSRCASRARRLRRNARTYRCTTITVATLFEQLPVALLVASLMRYLTIIGGVFIAWLILVVFFAPHIPYHVEEPVDPRSDHFIHVLESTCNTTLNRHNKIDDSDQRHHLLSGHGRRDSRRAEKRSTWSATSSRRAKSPTASSTRCASARAAGVHVTIVLDAIGSFGAFRTLGKRLRECRTCRVERYQRLRWYSLARLNNRTHRELLVVDGRIAFVGGAGVADWWFKSTRGKPMWRDMMARIEGPIVSNIQGIVAENWLECCGEILTSVRTYQPRPRERHQSRIRDQELARRSRHRLAGPVSDARGVGHRSAC